MHNITNIATPQIPLVAQVVLLMESFLISFFNGVVWLLFLKHQHLRNRSNVFLVSLSSAHFFLGALGVPFYVWARKAHIFDIVSTAVLYFFLCAAILNMYLVTYERYLSILKPLHYNQRMSKRFMLSLVCVAWIFPIIPTSIDVLFRTAMKIHRLSLGYIVYHWIQTLSFLAISFPLAAVNIAVFRAAKRQFQAIQAVLNIGNTLRQFRTSARREKRTTFFFVYIVATFFVFWLPRIFSVVYELITHDVLEHTLPDIVTLCIALLNPIFDPLIYLFYKSDFKKVMRRMLFRRHQVGPGVTHRSVTPRRNVNFDAGNSVYHR